MNIYSDKDGSQTVKGWTEGMGGGWVVDPEGDPQAPRRVVYFCSPTQDGVTGRGTRTGFGS